MTSVLNEPLVPPRAAGEPLSRPAPSHANDRAMMLLALCIGAAITLCVQGYQFGRSNHTVYLLDALHRSDPSLLANDWFTTQTFQYHAVFGLLTRGLMRVGLLEPGFLVGYLALVALFHIAWLRIVTALGGGLQTYLASVLLYYLSAGGTGLGMYQFFQDASFLPSNVANVAMLWAVCLWIEGRLVGSGAWFGVAGLFHLNHAIAGAACWCILVTLDRPKNRTRLLIGSVLVLAPCVANIAFAAILGLRHRAASVPLDEFVALYVRLRHPHHYDPRSWPLALWIAFVWPLPLAVLARQMLLRRGDVRSGVDRAMHIFLIFAAMSVTALIGAGLFYVSATLIQMSLYRFSIYVQLLACIGAAIVVSKLRFATAVIALVLVGAVVFISISATGVAANFVDVKRGAVAFFCLTVIAAAMHPAIARLRHPRVRTSIGFGIIAAIVLPPILDWQRWTGLALIFDAPDPAYLATCGWARANTPVDAVFVVPPQETEFRYYARRAIVVNFKGVPQLSSELGAWRDRLRDVLGLADLTTLPLGNFGRANRAIGEVYDGRSAAELFAAARSYGARYVVATHDLGAEPMTRDRLAAVIEGRYFLYDLAAHESARESEATSDPTP